MVLSLGSPLTSAVVVCHLINLVSLLVINKEVIYPLECFVT